MVSFHLHYQTISRGKKRSATRAASYRSASRIKDTRERRRNRHHLREEAEAAAEGSPIKSKGKVHDYRAKMGVVKTLIKLPEWAQKMLLDRSVLWNAAEDAEVRCNAVVAREMDVALPHELPFDEQWGCAEDMGDWLIERYRCGVDIAFHMPGRDHDQRNFHAHIMFTSRELTPEGFGEKTRVLDAFKTRDAEIRAMRQAWQDIVNARLAKAGLDVRIDCRSYADQGIDRIPQIHVGANGMAMADRGVKPESRAQYDSRGRLIDWEKIDNGLSRVEHNANVIKLNERADQQGSVPVHVQIRNIDRYINLLIAKHADIQALIPASMLPTWVRELIEKYRLKARDLYESFIQAKMADEQRQEERRREGNHAKMKRIEKEIEELERAKERRQALQRLYTKIEAFVAMRPPLVSPIERTPTRILSVEQYRVEMVAKAEMARARVPPEYRPRMAVKDVIWDSVDNRHDEGSLGYHFHTGPPAYNGGLAEPPPPITGVFNEKANPLSEQPYKQRVSIGFGI